METFIALLSVNITHKDTTHSTWIKLATLMWIYLNINNTSKDTWFEIWCGWHGEESGQCLKWSFILKSAGWCSINEVSSRIKSLPSKIMR
jgi:hypothetical protein